MTYYWIIKNMSKKFNVPIIIILVLSIFISAPIHLELDESISTKSSLVEFEANNLERFNTSLIIKNNTNFQEKSLKYNWTGNGTEDDPFLISNYHFNMDRVQTGIYIENTDVNFVIKNCNITNSSCGIVLSEVENATIKNNQFYNNNCGIRIFNSDENEIESNLFHKIKTYSIYIEGDSYGNDFHNNSMWGPGFYFKGDKIAFTSQEITENNKVNGKPVFYFTSEDFKNKLITGDPGQIIISNCSNGRIKNLDINNTNIGLIISFSNDLNLENLNISHNVQQGVQVINSREITLNKLNSSSNQHGLYLMNVENSSISNNLISHNEERGISIIYSENNQIKRNKINNNEGNGIDIFSSRSNIISDNLIRNNNNNGMNLHTYTKSDFGPINASDHLSNNTITDNLFENNQEYGLKLIGFCENNKIYFNSFVHNQGSNDTYEENTIQAFEEDINETEDNTWSSQKGYGNYWSDWTSPDENNDFIVDIPYHIEGSNAQDDFPLTSYLSSVSRFSAKSGRENIELAWSKPKYSIIYPVSQYKLYKGLGKENISLYKTFNSSVFYYTDPNVTSENTYYYQLEAVNTEEHFSKSQIISSSPDDIPPEIVSHSPSNERVDVYTNITVKFSEPMQRDSVKIEFLKEDESINGSLHWDQNVLIFDPGEKLDYKTTYSVKVDGKDRAGNNLTKYTWSFKTEILTRVTGKIVDSKGKPISNVSVKSDTGENTTTDEDGRFMILLKPGKRMLTIEKEGYEIEKKDIDVDSDSPNNLDKIQITKSDSGGTNWFVPLAIFGITTTILAIIAVIAFFKEQEEIEEEIKDEEEFFKDLYEDDFEEVSKEEFESWWEDRK